MSRQRPRLLFLHTRLSGYLLACLEHFAQTAEADVLVVRKPADPLAPYRLTSDIVELVDHDQYTRPGLSRMVKSFRPSVAHVSGWRDLTNLRIARSLRQRGIPVILGSDTPWRATVRQRTVASLSRITLHQCFTHMWVPGPRQVALARKVGFDGEFLRTGVYSADVSTFTAEPAATKRFVFAGRLVPVKGVDLLAAAWAELHRELPDWKLLVVGSGPLDELFRDKAGVETSPFLPPHELAALGQAGGVFVLPSRDEPWGLVVHEFASLGYPLVVSEAVGAGDVFVRDGVNGSIFSTGDGADLHRSMRTVATAEPASRLAMGTESQRLSTTISHETWSATLREISQYR